MLHITHLDRVGFLWLLESNKPVRPLSFLDHFSDRGLGDDTGAKKKKKKQKKKKKAGATEVVQDPLAKVLSQ